MIEAISLVLKTHSENWQTLLHLSGAQKSLCRFL